MHTKQRSTTLSQNITELNSEQLKAAFRIYSMQEIIHL